MRRCSTTPNRLTDDGTSDGDNISHYQIRTVQHGLESFDYQEIILEERLAKCSSLPQEFSKYNL